MTTTQAANSREVLLKPRLSVLLFFLVQGLAILVLGAFILVDGISNEFSIFPRAYSSVTQNWKFASAALLLPIGGLIVSGPVWLLRLGALVWRDGDTIHIKSAKLYGSRRFLLPVSRYKETTKRALTSKTGDRVLVRGNANYLHIIDTETGKSLTNYPLLVVERIGSSRHEHLR